MGDPRGEVAMGDDDGGDVAWRQVMKDLQAGQVVEIPVAEGEMGKKRRQLSRRAERRGMTLELTGETDILRARKTGDTAPTGGSGGDEAAGQERRERRRAARAGDGAE